MPSLTPRAAAPKHATAAPIVPDIGEILSRRHLPALDGLRACSVGVVMAYHFGFSSLPGDLGVSAFFVLSGFLITWLLLREYQRDGTVSMREFYLRRLLRIFPAYYVFLGISFSIDFVRGDPRVRELVLPGITYLMNYYNALHGHPPTSIAHAWSLAIEEQFYLLWPAAFLILVKMPRRRAISLLVGTIVLFASWRSFVFLTRVASVPYVYNAFETRADILAIGCLLAFMLQSRRVQRVARYAAYSSILPLCTVAALLLSRLGGNADYHYSLGFAVDGILLALLILQLLLLHRSVLWSWLDWRATRFLGAVSYPLYLYHIWGFGVAGRLMPDHTGTRMVLAVVISLLLAVFSYYLVEKPFMRLKSRFAADRVSRVATVI